MATGAISGSCWRRRSGKRHVGEAVLEIDKGWVRRRMLPVKEKKKDKKHKRNKNHPSVGGLLVVETGDRLGATTNSPRSLHLPSLEGKERTRHRPPPTAQTPGKMQHPMPTGGGTGRGSQPRHGHVTGNGWAWMGLQRRHSSLCMHSPSSPNSRVLRVLPGCTATHAARQTLDRFGRTLVSHLPSGVSSLSLSIQQRPA